MEYMKRARLRRVQLEVDKYTISPEMSKTMPIFIMTGVHYFKAKSNNKKKS